MTIIMIIMYINNILIGINILITITSLEVVMPEVQEKILDVGEVGVVVALQLTACSKSLNQNLLKRPALSMS